MPQASLQKMTDIGYSPFTIKQFLSIFFPIALVVAALIAAMTYHSHALDQGNLQASQAHSIAIAADALNQDFNSIFADLALLSTSRNIRQFTAQPTAANRSLAETELKIFHRYKSLYNNISLVSSRGELLLSTHDLYSNGSIDAINRDLLQQLQKAFHDRPGRDIVASPLILPDDDQNAPRPMMHFAIAIRSAPDQLDGALVASYTTSRLLQSQHNVLVQVANTQLLINRAGDWLQHSGDSHNEAWTATQPKSFQSTYPHAWQNMLSDDSGQFQINEGLFAFATLYPASINKADSKDAQQAGWFIASLITTETLRAAIMAEFGRSMFIYSLLLLPIALLSLFITRLISARQYNQRRIRALSAAVEQSHDMVLITDAAGRIRYVNPRFEAITGYSRAEAIGNSPGMLKSGKHTTAFYRQLWDTIQRGQPFESTISNRKKNGELFHAQVTISPLTDKSGTIGYISSGKDITRQVSTQERLLKLAFHHPLTGLPNRSLFRDHLHDAAARARRSNHQVAVLFIDLDRFKQVNDSLGHQVGDALLVSVAKRLREAVREIDMVAHLGGDEFTVLLDDIEHPNQVQAVTTKLLQLFEQPFLVNERELYIGASIGIAIFPTDHDNVENLVEQADTAMYQAKRSGRGHFQFYSAEMTTLANERLELESQLRIALQQQEFKLLFQPIVDPIRRELRGLEALLRWHQADGTVRSPDDFIPILEETGMIIPITSWVLNEACRQHCRLQAVGLGRLRVNVNISARSFYQSNLIDIVRNTLEQNNMPPSQLVLEVTESLLLEDQLHVQDSLERLRQLGVAIAIDDFGTGYSSLAYLRRLPISIIKIDRAFIHSVGADTRDAALVSAMMAMAQELQMDVVAEGVEHIHQLDFLRERHCRGAQGFLFSPPMPASHINAWLTQDPHWPWKRWMNHHAEHRLH